MGKAAMGFMMAKKSHKYRESMIDEGIHDVCHPFFFYSNSERLSSDWRIIDNNVPIRISFDREPEL